MDKVRIGYLEFTIKEFPEGFGLRLDGETNFTRQTIHIDQNNSPEVRANTLLHEIMHVCWSMAALNDEDKEERIVTALANGLSQVIRDNPDAAAYIIDGLKT